MKELTSVDWCFETPTKAKGYYFYNKCTFDKIYKTNNKYETTIEGYEVMVDFSNNKKDCIDNDKCSCDYYDNNGECKHVYALICKIKKVPKNLDIDFYKIEEEQNKDVTTISYTIDHSSLLRLADEKLANLDYNVLFKVKDELVKRGEDTSLIDKAINTKKERDKEIKEQNKLSLGDVLTGVFLGLNIGNKKANKKDNNIMPWEQDEENKENYEPHNFEEEELEEDDYYYEDDK